MPVSESEIQQLLAAWAWENDCHDPEGTVAAGEALAAALSAVHQQLREAETEEPYYQAVCGSWDCRAPECRPKGF